MEKPTHSDSASIWSIQGEISKNRSDFPPGQQVLEAVHTGKQKAMDVLILSIVAMACSRDHHCHVAVGGLQVGGKYVNRSMLSIP